MSNLQANQMDLQKNCLGAVVAECGHLVGSLECAHIHWMGLLVPRRAEHFQNGILCLKLCPQGNDLLFRIIEFQVFALRFHFKKDSPFFCREQAVFELFPFHTGFTQLVTHRLQAFSRFLKRESALCFQLTESFGETDQEMSPGLGAGLIDEI
jgi:hypothetical protein